MSFGGSFESFIELTASLFGWPLIRTLYPTVNVVISSQTVVVGTYKPIADVFWDHTTDIN